MGLSVVLVSQPRAALLGNKRLKQRTNMEIRHIFEHKHMRSVWMYAYVCMLCADMMHVCIYVRESERIY